jgi:hypothetical protein
MGRRVPLTDGSGAWFSTDSAVMFDEDTRWDGRNRISVPTGSQWEHQILFYTKSGKWVLNDYSNYQGTREGYAQIDESAAVAWLIQNRHTESKKLEKLPESVRQSVQAGIAAAEI